MRGWGIGTVVALMAATAPTTTAAQLGEPADEPTTVEPPEPETAEAEGSRDASADGDARGEGEDDAGWQTLGRAGAYLSEGRAADARRLLEWLARTGRPAPARAAQAVLDGLSPAGGLDRPSRPTLTAPPPPHDRTGAMVELAVVQTMAGAGFGTSICILARCAEPAPFAGLGLLGAGGGLVLALTLPGPGFTTGDASAVNLGTVWGVWTGAAIAGLLERPSQEEAASVLLFSQVLGTSIGALAAWGLRPSEGAVSMAGSLGAWSIALSVAVMGAGDFRIGGNEALGITLGVGSVGLLAGALLHDALPYGRARVLVVDACGVLGAGLGIGASVLISNTYDAGAFWGSTIVGSLGGLVTCALLTPNMDGPSADLDVAVSATPLPEGARLSLSGRF